MDKIDILFFSFDFGCLWKWEYPKIILSRVQPARCIKGEFESYVIVWAKYNLLLSPLSSIIPIKWGSLLFAYLFNKINSNFLTVESSDIDNLTGFEYLTPYLSYSVSLLIIIVSLLSFPPSLYYSPVKDI